MIEYLLIFISVLVIYIFVNHKKDGRLPPGIYGWPIIGEIPSFKIGFFDQVKAYQRKFGDVFLWKIGARNVVFLCEPKLIKKSFHNPSLLYRPGDQFSFNSRCNFKKVGILNNEGYSWQVHRRFTLHHLRDSGFGTSTVESIVQMEAEKLINELQANYLNTPTSAPLSINLATMNVIWKIAADITLHKDDEDLKTFLATISKIFHLIQGYMTLLDIFPWAVPLMPNFVLRKIGYFELQATRTNLKNYYKSVINKRKATLNRDNPIGLIDSYLLKLEENTDEPFTEDDLVNILSDLFFAGSDTTASTLKWVLQYMAKYPEIQTKIQNEIDNVVPKDRLPSISDKPRLPFTEATTYEVLRLTSLFPIAVLHAAGEDTTIEQYFIPKNTTIVPFLYGCHTDARYWDKPNEFYPEHFLDENGNFTAKNEAFMPFSLGKRMCLGESLARTELFLFFSAILQKFTISLPPGEENINLNPDSKNVLVRIPTNNKIIIRERK